MIDPDRPRNLHMLPTTAEVLNKILDDPDNFEDIDDDEIDTFLLTEEESKFKERVWIGLNEEFLLEQEQKRLKAEADEISGHQQPHALDEIDVDGINGAIKDLAGSSAAQGARNMLSKKS
ncbi:Transcription factor IIIB 70 kDa subunit, partial [Cyberlindnera fabianii]